MGYGSIIKRAWKITWRYRALWVLGLFAGVTGSSGGGGGNYNMNSLGSNSGSKSSPFSGMSGASFLRTLESWLPIIIVVTLGLIIIGIVWWILSVAARGGLVFAVNEIEEGRPMKLGHAWNAGFARFWSIFGLSLLLALPVIALLIVMVLLIIVPVLIPLARGGQPGPAVFAPICGTLVLGLPLLIVLSIVLGLLHELALRFVMLSGHGAVSAVGESWRAFRGRFKDTSLMWLIGFGLNMAAGFVLAIPLIILTLLVVVPAIVAGVAGQWAALAGVILVAFLVVMVISLAFTAVWGTFSSALWTVFFRRFTGMDVQPADAQPAVPPAPDFTAYAPPPPPLAPPAPPAPPASPASEMAP
jgi:hypothetical protein